MAKSPLATLSRRERQIMEILYKRGSATAADVMRDLPGALSDSTVRTHLRILEEKGHVRHEEQDLRYVFFPKFSSKAVRQSALKQLIETFFDGSVEDVVATLIGAEGSQLSEEQLKRIAEMIERAKKGSRR
jgi:BlaI family transcriptional regulator, penicillinase repressor